MGQDPTDDSYEAGDACLLCVDLLFGGVTPKYVHAHVTGIIQCPFRPAVPDDGVYLLTQELGCKWSLWIGELYFEWILIPGFSFFYISYFVEGCFFNRVSESCADHFENENLDTCPGDNAGHGGTVDIFWGPTIGP